MTAHRSRRWFQLSLKSLFLLTLLVATFFAGYAVATKQAETERRRAELEAQRAIEEARLQAEAQSLQAQLAQPQAWSSTWSPLPQQPQPWTPQP
jgi:hypothetical protein